MTSAIASQYLCLGFGDQLVTIYDRPELHADEMIGLVLQFLTEFSLQNPSVSAGNDDGTTMAMSVKSLHSLCSAEVFIRMSCVQYLHILITRWLISQQLGT